MEIIDDKYRVENIKLGSGGFSEVYLGTNIIMNQLVAIKKVSLLQKNILENNTLNKLKMEIELMQKFKHPNIVTYYDVVKTTTHWYIIMEYCNMGTLDDIIKFNELMSKKKSINFNREANTYYYLNQLKDALNYVRRLGYIHRDIKPMNVLLTQNMPIESSRSLSDSGILFGQDEQIVHTMDRDNLDRNEKIIVKLADFGLAKHYMENEESLMNTICGSPLYMAPELIFNKEYNSKADLWSFGIIMYQMLFGIHPNNATTFPQLVKNLRSKNIDFHLGKNFTQYCFDLLTKLLVKDSQLRIDWRNFFNHKWFSYWENINNEEHNIFNNKISMNSVDDDKITMDSASSPIGIITSNNENIIKPSIPIKIINNPYTTEKINNSPEYSFKFPSQIGSPNNSIGSPLGHSNLTKMKLDNFYPLNMTQVTYSDYPSSYPPTDPRRIYTRSLNISINKPQSSIKPISIPINSSTNSFKNPCKNSSIYNDESISQINFSRSFDSLSTNKLENYENRIFKTNRDINQSDNLNKSSALSNQQILSKLDMSEFVIMNYEGSKNQN